MSDISIQLLVYYKYFSLATFKPDIIDAKFEELRSKNSEKGGNYDQKQTKVAGSHSNYLFSHSVGFLIVTGWKGLKENID